MKKLYTIIFSLIASINIYASDFDEYVSNIASIDSDTSGYDEDTSDDEDASDTEDPNANLITAIKNNDCKSVEIAIERGASVNFPYRYLKDIMHRRSFEILKCLIEHGAKINHPNDRTLLLSALNHKKGDIAKYLIQKGANLDARGSNNKTALVIAIYHEDIDMVNYLLEHNANINQECKTGTPLAHAAIINNLEMFNLLLQKGARFHTIKDFITYNILYRLIENNQLETIKSILNHGAKINYPDTYTLLMLAVEEKKSDIAKYLIHKNADLNVRNYNDETALTIALRNKDVDVIKSLLDNGVDTTNIIDINRTDLDRMRLEHKKYKMILSLHNLLGTD